MSHGILATVLSLLLLAQLGIALSPTFLPCQLQKPTIISPLVGCPPGTLFVSPKDSRAHFTKVQDAVSSLYGCNESYKNNVLRGLLDRPHTGSAVILVGEGEYHETVNITREAPITLLVR